MNSDVESRIKYWDEHGEDLVSPLASSAAEGIRSVGWDDGDALYEVLMSDGESARTTRRECHTCGNVIDVEPTSEVTAWRRRLTQACDHQRAVLKGVNVGGCCECGALAVEATDHEDSYGNVVMVSYACAGCGKSRSEQ